MPVIPHGDDKKFSGGGSDPTSSPSLSGVDEAKVVCLSELITVLP